MKLWFRSLLGIVPVFLALTVAVSLLVGYLVPREIEWGYREESTGLAVAIAAFIDPSHLDTLSATESASLRRILDTTRARRIYILDTDNKKVYWDLNASKGDTPPPRFPLTQVQSDSVVEFFDFAGTGMVVAFATCTATRNSAVVGVELDTPLLDDISNMLWGMYTSKGTVTLSFGIWCALFIGAVLRRNLRRLTITAEKVAAGKTDWVSVQRGYIQEFRDLWNAIETVACVVMGGIAKSRNRLMTAERFLSPAQLLSSLQQLRFGSRAVETDCFSISLRAVGTPPPGAFFELWSEGNATFYIYGMVVEEDDRIDTGVAASAAMRYLKAALRHSPLEETIESAAALFSLKELRIDVFQDGEASGVRLNNGQVERHRHSRNETHGFGYFCDLDPRLEQKVALYLDTFCDLGNPTEVSSNIELLLQRAPSPRFGTFGVFHAKIK